MRRLLAPRLGDFAPTGVFGGRRPLLLAAPLVTITLFWWMVGLAVGHLFAENVRSALASLGPLAPLAYVVALALSIVLAFVPNVVMVMMSGAVFGFGPGLAYTMIGGLVGAAINFELAHRLGRPRLRRWLGRGRLAQ